MSSQTTLADIAFVVSLVALVISFSQMVQSFLGTADGYRRCKSSIIGPWAQRTHRHWLWTEFRFETRYTTPEISLLTDNEFYEAKSFVKRHHSKDEDDLDDERAFSSRIGPEGPYRLIFDKNRKVEIDQTVHSSRLGDDYVDSTLRATWVLFLKVLHDMEAYNWPGECRGNYPITWPSQAIWKNFARRLAARWARVMRSRVVSAVKNAAHIHIHRAEAADSLSKAEKIELESPQTIYCEASSSTDKYLHSFSEKQRPSRGNPDGTNTNVTITYRELSWDFMPPDVVRPLATSNVGTVVVLALRLGMRWRSILPAEDGGMQADGNGYSLSSSRTRGLGIVLQFTRDPAVKRPALRPMIPSVYVDKLMCGLLPLCPRLFKSEQDQDIPMVFQDTAVVAKATGLLDKLELRVEDRRDFMRAVDAHVKTTFWIQPGYNEVLVAMMPFLPLEGCRFQGVEFNGWLRGRRDSCFVMREGRQVFLDRINKHAQIEHRQVEPPSLNSLQVLNLQWIRDVFQFLGIKYQDDFRQHHTWSLISGRNILRGHLNSAVVAMRPLVERNDRKYLKEEDAAADAQALRDELRDIHNKTTRYFEDLTLPDKQGSSVTMVHILAAHLVMAYKTAVRAREDFEHEKDKKIRGLHEEFDRGEKYYRPGIAQVFQLAKFYCDKVAQDEFYTQLTEYRGCDISREDAETAWWMLMLRGIVWEMSVWVNIQPPCVPARFFGNQMPVWIT